MPGKRALSRRHCSVQPERQEAFTTSSMTVARVYTPLDVAEMEYDRDLGLPGEYPFTRGVQPTMYRGRFWTMRQYAGFGTAEESNEKFRYLLSQGQTGLSVAFDLPSQLGYDSDDPMAIAEVGQVGVAIDSLYDMETLFEDIPLDEVSTSMTINAPAGVMLAMYIAAAEKQGVSSEKLMGTVQNDVLKEYVARGTYIFPPGPSVRLAADLMAYCAEHVPKWNTISVSGYHMREAGCDGGPGDRLHLRQRLRLHGCGDRTGARRSMISPRGSAGSSTPTTISSRRLQSTGRCGGSGPRC